MTDSQSMAWDDRARLFHRMNKSQLCAYIEQHGHDQGHMLWMWTKRSLPQWSKAELVDEALRIDFPNHE